MAFVLCREIDPNDAPLWFDPSYARAQIVAGTYNDNRRRNTFSEFYDSLRAGDNKYGGINDSFDLNQQAVVMFAQNKDKLVRGLQARADVKCFSGHGVTVYRNNYGSKVASVLRTAAATPALPFKKAFNNYRIWKQAGGLSRDTHLSIFDGEKVVHEPIVQEPIQYASWKTVASNFKRRHMVGAGYYIVVCSMQFLPYGNNGRRTYIVSTDHITIGTVASSINT